MSTERPFEADVEALSKLLAEHLPIRDGVPTEFFGPRLSWIKCSCGKWKSSTGRGHRNYDSEHRAEHRQHLAAVLAEHTTAAVREIEAERDADAEELAHFAGVAEKSYDEARAAEAERDRLREGIAALADQWGAVDAWGARVALSGDDAAAALRALLDTPRDDTTGAPS